MVSIKVSWLFVAVVFLLLVGCTSTTRQMEKQEVPEQKTPIPENQPAQKTPVAVPEPVEKQPEAIVELPKEIVAVPQEEMPNVVFATGKSGSSLLRLGVLKGEGGNFTLSFASGPIEIANNPNGELHPAIGDINGDGIPEIVVGRGDGGNSTVDIVDLNGKVILRFQPFCAQGIECKENQNPTGAVHIALGDIDGNEDIFVSGGAGSSSLVSVYGFEAGNVVNKGSFRAFDDSSNAGEVHVAIGDVDNDGKAEIMASTGSKTKDFKTGMPSVAIFYSNAYLTSKSRLMSSISAYFPLSEDPSREVFVDVGNFALPKGFEIVGGAGIGDNSRVSVYDYKGFSLVHFNAFSRAQNIDGEVHVAAGNFDGQGYDEILVTTGSNGDGQYRLFDNGGKQLLIKDAPRIFDKAQNPGGEINVAVV